MRKQERSFFVVFAYNKIALGGWGGWCRCVICSNVGLLLFAERRRERNRIFYFCCFAVPRNQKNEPCSVCQCHPPPKLIFPRDGPCAYVQRCYCYCCLVAVVAILSFVFISSIIA
ncbi:hypothetical protein BDB00DRAFT_824986 [Zychaea mexicana]|uniref:uncharacterized protein n=1 Tax=Zychaea mexicana TaxID=64656 RepID=UPI0022FE9E84|nr:uncharacterized protein BDB00DRAFT_824986 [Zychaea mexicana]KAI9493027.1 hypothetical protein BDB00DRAFT_824986 [Zychaea mexicana]